jgi:hypothetical protein
MSLLCSLTLLNLAALDFGIVALSRGACVQDAEIADCHRGNAAIRHVCGREPAR